MSSSTSTPTFPLLTIFTPPSSCLPRSWTSFTNCDAYVDPSEGVNSFYCTPSTRTSDCLPSGYTTINDGYNLPEQPFSPGVCPSAYFLVAASIQDIGSTAKTTQYCCPSYVCTGFHDRLMR